MAIYPLDPSSETALTLKLFRNVKNSALLRKRTISKELQCCLVNPQLILSPFQVVVAANKAVSVEKTTTKDIYTEILFNLSITKNIKKSLERFAITDESTDLLLCLIGKDEVSDLVEGTEVELEELKVISDLNVIKKEYKIAEKEVMSGDILNSIVSRIATKDFVSH